MTPPSIHPAPPSGTSFSREAFGFPTSTMARQFCRALLERHGVSEAKLEELQHRARWLQQPLDTLALRERLLGEEPLRDLLAEISGLNTVSLTRTGISAEAIARVSPATVNRCRVIPLALRGKRIVLAGARIIDPAEAEQLRVLLGMPVEHVLCTVHELDESIKHYYGVGLESFLNAEPRPREGGDGESHAEAAPDISHFVKQLLDEAIAANATDVHIEPRHDSLRLRYRIDGVLYPVTLPVGAERFQRAIVSSIKVMAQLNIAERRIPQDGRFTHGAGRDAYDIRLSVLPTRHGETVTLRILNRQSTFLSLNELGLTTQQKAEIEDLIALPHGIVLFTGPTGSGKTTSLYAALARLNTDDRKIVTLEDPVEYDMEGVTQLQVQPGIGFTFPAGLRSVLRHDPDVILIGEIRDAETAGIAVSSAFTGHLVFSTLHTQDTSGAVVRLIDMGIEPYLVAAGVQGMVAQRLLRRICPACREAYTEDPAIEAEARSLFPERTAPLAFYRGRGCPECRFLGYNGRQGIYEVFLMNNSLRRLVIERASSDMLLKQAMNMGLAPLRRNAWACALEGVTTVGDVLRMTSRPAFHPPPPTT